MKGRFERNELTGFFEDVGGEIGQSCIVFLLGGGAMCLRNQKTSTKDVDLVFRSESEYQEFCQALKKIGFTQRQETDISYVKMETASIWDRKDGGRVDMFVRKVCNALELSDSIASRCEPVGDFGKLNIQMLSNEDLILFKAITERIDDTNDIASIIRSSSIDWQIILEECKKQSVEQKWYALVYDKLIDLQTKHQITVPEINEFEKLALKGILQEAYERRRGNGLSAEEAVKDLKKLGFSDQELKGIKHSLK